MRRTIFVSRESGDLRREGLRGLPHSYRPPIPPAWQSPLARRVERNRKAREAVCHRMLSSPMDAMRPPQRQCVVYPRRAFFLEAAPALAGLSLAEMEMEISGSILVPSSAEKVRVSGTQAPRRTHDQTTRPKAVTVAVADVTSTTMAAAGCPRRPGIDSLASIRSAVSGR